MAISSFEGQEVKYVGTIFKGSKGQYLGPWATNHKTKDTLLPQTFKVEEKKSPYFFDFWPRSRDMAISSFDDFTYFTSEPSKDEMAISRLLGHKSKQERVPLAEREESIFLQVQTSIR